jgi:hypothetical protein
VIAAAPPQVLFRGAAEAVRLAQQQLDFLLPSRPPRVFAIPEMSIHARFDTVDREGRVLWIFGREAEEHRRNALRFTLRLAPAPQPPLAGIDRPVPSISIPPWLASPDEQARLQMHCGHTVALRLSQRGERYLLIRAGKRRHELFVAEIAEDGVRVDAIRTGDRVPWAPFHELFTTLREWQRRGLLAVPVAGVIPSLTFGRIDVAGFIDSLWTGYSAARAELGQRSRRPFYRIDDVCAQLSYAVPDAKDDRTYIRGEVDVRIAAPGTSAHMAVALGSPEFIVTGAARQELLARTLEFVLDRNEAFWKGLADSADAGAYRAAFVDRNRQAEAVFVLASGEVPAKNEFLSVWTAAVAGEEREFAWRFEVEKGSLRKARIVLPLRESNACSYDGVHGFLSAVCRWNAL